MKYKLSNEGIDQFLLDIEGILKAGQYINREIRAKLILLEEILLTYRKEFGDEVEFEMVIKRRFRITNMVLKIYCQCLDYRELLEEDDFIIKNLINSVTEREIWSFRKGCNVITMTINKRKKAPQIVWILVGAVSAYIFFNACALTSAGVTDFFDKLAEEYLLPAVYAILRMIAGCLIFFSIASAITSMGNLDVFKKVIARMMRRMSYNYIAIIAVFTFVFVAVFGIGDAGGKGDQTALLKLIFDMIPSDIVTPFIEGNMFQITVLAIVFGILMIVLGDGAKPARDLIDCFRQFSILAMQAFCSILPFVVFLNIFVICDTIGDMDIAQGGIAIVVGIAATFIVASLAGLSISIRTGMGIMEFTRRASEGTLVALSTASSSAALADTKESLLGMGIKEEFVDLMLPLQQAFYKPFSIVIIYTGMFTVSQVFDTSFSWETLIRLAIITFVLANACPPVPGGVISCLAVLEAQFVLPSGAMAILILISTVMDYIGTGLSMYLIHAETLGIAKSFGKVEERENV